MSARNPKPRSKPPRAPQWLSVEQRTNALIKSAQEAAQRPKRVPVQMDWDSCIVRLRAMLDKLEET